MRILMLMGLCALLSACNLGPINSAGSVICANRDAARIGLIAALTKAGSIADPVKREAAIGAINTSLAALDRCPPPGG